MLVPWMVVVVAYVDVAYNRLRRSYCNSSISVESTSSPKIARTACTSSCYICVFKSTTRLIEGHSAVAMCFRSLQQRSIDVERLKRGNLPVRL